MINFNKKILFLVGFLLFLLITLILVNLFYRGKTEQQPQPVISAQVEYPQIQVNQSDSQVIPLPNVDTLKLPQQLPIYQVIPRSPILEQTSEKLANSFGISRVASNADNDPVFISLPSQGEASYLWQKDNRSLVQFPKSGVFEFSAPLSQNSQPEDLQKAKETVLNLLAANNLLPSDYNLKADYILLPNFSLSNKDNFSIYRIILEPKVDNVPVLSYKSSGEMIIVYLSKDFSFFKFDYSFVSVNKIEQTIKLIPLNDLIDNIYTKKIAPSFIDLPNMVEYLDPTVSIKSVKIIKAEVIYYLSSRNDTILYPTYKITTEIQTEDGISGSAVYLLKAF